VRWWGAAVVAALHGLVLLALLLHKHMEGPNAVSLPAMRWIDLKPEKPLPILSLPARAAPKIAAPPAVTLPPPQVTISSPEASHTSPVTLPPNPNAPSPPSSSAGRRDYNDLFPAEKKEQLKRFFAEQAITDRRENARPGNRTSPCDIFKKPDDLGTAGEPPNTGVTKTFKPALVFGTGGSDEDGVSAQACN